MRKLPLRSVFKIILEGRSSTRFLIGTIFSFSFSMAVILCTIGLMDGFELTLKKALSFANGDIKMTSNRGFYLDDDTFKSEIKKNKDIQSISSLLQVESFALVNEESKGVLLKGINPEEFKNITGLDVANVSDGVIIGKEFAQKYGLKTEDSFTLALASGKSQDQGSAILQEVKVKGVVEHGVYEKDMRFIYIEKSKLENVVSYKKGVSNISLIKIKPFSNIESVTKKLNNTGFENYRFEPYWSEFEVLLDAVQVEKFSISLILQLIVLVAILNIVAFIFYISEVKAQDLFMLRALGLSYKTMKVFWMTMLVLIWFVSVLISFGFKELFAYILGNLPFLKIPGDVYVLSQLKVLLDPIDYLYVYGASLLWVLIIGFVILKKLSRKSVLASLREEFS